jgi:hypothetical protein
VASDYNGRYKDGWVAGVGMCKLWVGRVEMGKGVNSVGANSVGVDARDTRGKEEKVIQGQE